MREKKRPVCAGRQPPRLTPFPAARLQDECRRARPDDAIEGHRLEAVKAMPLGSPGAPVSRCLSPWPSAGSWARCRARIPSMWRPIRCAGRSTSSGPATRSPPTWRPRWPPGRAARGHGAGDGGRVARDPSTRHHRHGLHPPDRICVPGLITPCISILLQLPAIIVCLAKPASARIDVYPRPHYLSAMLNFPLESFTRWDALQYQADVDPRSF